MIVHSVGFGPYSVRLYGEGMNNNDTPRPTIRRKGHKLETISTRGGIMAGCSCGHSHKGRRGAALFETWDRELIRERQRAHVEGLPA